MVSIIFYFPFHIWDVNLPIDELIFFTMVKTTNQIPIWLLHKNPTKNCGVFQGTRARHGRCQRPGGKRSVRPENCRQSVMDMSQRFGDLPSGKQPHIYGKSPFLMGKSTISMAIFNSQLLNYQMVKVDIKLRLFSID